MESLSRKDSLGECVPSSRDAVPESNETEALPEVISKSVPWSVLFEIIWRAETGERGNQMLVPRLSGRNCVFFSSLIGVLVVLICSACVATEAWAVQRDKGALYAVIVGIKTFKDPKIPPLTISDKDAADFHKFLKERENYFSKAQLTVLLNEKATRANVSKALRQDLRKAGKDDVVIIYLSGHGAADPNLPNEYYFVTHDAQLDNLFASAVMMNDQNLFKGIDTDRVLLVADACHAGGFSPGLQKSIAKETDRFFSLFQ